MPISPQMNDRLNDQINFELFSSYVYLAMAADLDKTGLKVFAQFYYAQAEEERMHAMKMFKYVQDSGGTVILKAIEEPRASYDSVEELVTVARDHEVVVTNRIHGLVALAEEEKDYATRSFLQWYVDEQVQEVATADELVALVKMAGPSQLLPLEARVMALRSEGQ